MIWPCLRPRRAAKLSLLCVVVNLLSCAAPQTQEQGEVAPTVQAPPPAVKTPPVAQATAPDKPKPIASEHSRFAQGLQFDARSPAAFASELKVVETLLTKSSAAKRVCASGNAVAVANLQKAEQLLQAARKAEPQDGLELLSQAKQTLFTALRAISKPSRPQVEAKEYLKLAKTSRILLEAYGRIRQDKSAGDVNNIESRTRKELAQAEAYYQRGKMQLAEQHAASALRLVREAVVGLRSGDTLVRSLHFETPADEYAYESDRNQTHQLLVKLLIQKQSLAGTDLERVRQFLQKAQQLRQQAEAQASGADYPAAIKTLEKSTQLIIRAIRAAGIYIPG
jgi:hypothetical protein